MKQRMILYGLTLVLGCFVLASCINDEEGPCLSDGKAQVLFSLVLQDNAQTRADGDPETWGDFENPEPGVGYDNQIKLDEVQVLLFKGNAYLGKLTDLFYTQPDPDKSVYQYIGTAPLVDNEILTEGDYKFVVLANSTAITPASLDDGNFANLDFTYLGDATLPNIPMWGTTTTHLKPAAGTRDDIGTISLLRAVSKVTVKLNGTLEDLNGCSLEKVTVKNYNKSGYVLPSGYAGVASTADLVIDEENTMHVNDGDIDTTEAGMTLTPTGDNEITFYLPEYDNVSTGAVPSVLSVKLTKKVTVDGQEVTREFEAPIQFCDYSTEEATKGLPIAGTNYSIIRNHHYQFNIFKVSDDGELYVIPTVSDWVDGPTIEDYKIAVSTNMRLFDSWLYRYDTDGDYDNWNDSYMAVAPGLVTTEGVEKNKPLYSPQLQLMTTLPDDTSYSLELRLDNDAFQFVQVNKNENLIITSYSTHEEKLTIANGTDVYTYFYVVPKSTSAQENPIAKVTLVYNDPVVGELKLPFNRNALPGYSDDSSEFWVYFVAPDKYNDEQGYMKMYYQDAKNPLVPVN